MMNYLSTLAHRQVHAATFNYYAYPTLHPDRIMHEHDIFYVEHGDWEVSEEGISYELHPGDVIFLPAGKHHYGKRTCTPGTRTMFLHILADEADGQENNAFAIPSLIPAGTNPALRSHFLRLIDAWWTDGPHREIMISALANILLCSMASAGLQANERTFGWPVDAIHSLIVNEPAVNFTALMLSERLDVPERSLRYIFQKIAGCPIHRYQLNLKLSMAKQALQTTPSALIADVAQAFGFWDEYHFQHAFKKRFGHSAKKA